MSASDCRSTWLVESVLTCCKFRDSYRKHGHQYHPSHHHRLSPNLYHYKPPPDQPKASSHQQNGFYDGSGDMFLEGQKKMRKLYINSFKDFGFFIKLFRWLIFSRGWSNLSLRRMKCETIRFTHLLTLSKMWDKWSYTNKLPYLRNVRLPIH